MRHPARPLAAALLLGFAADAAAQGPLGPARVRAQVAEQKLAADVSAALATAERLAKIDPASAERVLRNQAFAVGRALDLGPDQKAAQLKRLDERLALFSPATKPTTAAPKPTPTPAAPVVTAAAAKSEAKEVNDTVREIAKLYEFDRFADAQARITFLGKKYPTNPAVIALEGRGLLAERMAEARQLARDQAERNSLALSDVDRSAVPTKGDIEFPAGYKEKMALRDKLSGVQLPPETEAILKALEARVPANLTGGPFREVVQSISNLIGKKMIVDDRAFADEGRDAGRAIELPTGVSARTALRAVTRAQGMTFVIKEDYIQIVTLEEARRSCVKRAYYIGDILTSPVGGGATYGPQYDFALSNQIAQMLVDNVRKSIDPSVWDGNGGFATVSFHAPSLSLVVSAPAEVQADVSKSMTPRR